MSRSNKGNLLVLTADADAKAVMESVLQRHQSLGIRKITFNVERHSGRDPGIMKDGPEFTRFYRNEFERVILLWDYIGCGWENRIDASACEAQIRKRLVGVTWKNRSVAVVIVPELEAWLWTNRASLRKHWKVTNKLIDRVISEYESNTGLKSGTAVKEQPKELFEHIQLRELHRTISPRDFSEIASSASLHDWESCGSFHSIVTALRTWFSKKVTRSHFR
jgi:hypothetical protein